MATAEVQLGDNPLAGESPDFILEPDQVKRGSEAVSSYLNSLKPGDGRRSAEDALQTLALLFSDGSCDAYEFPWQQVKAYHGAAAMNILKEEGTPARLESLRFERDPTRKYRQVPTTYSFKHVQKLRNSLRRVLSESHKLGFLSDEEFHQAIQLPKADGKRPTPGRVLTASEFRALTSACSLATTVAGHRDSLLLALGFQGGLFVNEMVALSLKDMKYDNRRGQVTVYVKGTKDSRGRTVPLQNGALIALEDWLAGRGDEPGPLLCPIRKGGQKVEIRRMTATAIRQACLKRAEEAGVEPFTPNDLRRNVVATRQSGGARKAQAPSAQTRPSALYMERPPEESDVERVLFPYQTRRLEVL